MFKKLVRKTKVGLINLLLFYCVACSTNPLQQSLPIDWKIVKQSQVNTLFESPQFLDYEGKKYELISFYEKATYRPSRGGIFSGSTLTREASMGFFLREKDVDYTANIKISKKLKAFHLWIINKRFEYYFETENINRLDNGVYSLAIPPKEYPQTTYGTIATPNTVIVEFLSISDNKSHFIKVIS